MFIWFDGYIDIYTSVRGSSTVQRAANEIQIVKNNVTLGLIANSGYIRNYTIHNASSSSLRILTSCKADDIIKVQSRQEAASGIVTMVKNSSTLLIKKIS